MSGADGMEQREAEREERHDAAMEEADVREQLADEVRAITVTPAERIAELKALLRDIAVGADMMLQPALGLRGSMLGYVREVKRVASAGKDV